MFLNIFSLYPHTNLVGHRTTIGMIMISWTKDRKLRFVGHVRCNVVDVVMLLVVFVDGSSSWQTHTCEDINLYRVVVPIKYGFMPSITNKNSKKKRTRTHILSRVRQIIGWIEREQDTETNYKDAYLWILHGAHLMQITQCKCLHKTIVLRVWRWIRENDVWFCGQICIEWANNSMSAGNWKPLLYYVYVLFVCCVCETFIRTIRDCW